MTFNEVCNKVAGEIPDGWEISIHLELGSGFVELFDCNSGDEHDFPSNRECIEDQLMDALLHAKELDHANKSRQMSF